MPPWVPFLLIAVIPAAIVGIIVFVLAGNGGSNSSSGGAAGIVDGLIRLGPSDQGTVTSFKDQLPPGFSTDFPVYSGAQVVVSESIGSAQGTSFFIVLSTPDAASKVYDYYLNALDKDPWQVEIGRSSSDFTGLRFSRPDNADVTGDITLYQSKLDNKTAVFLSYQDVSQSGTPVASTQPFVPGVSRPLPAGFPNDVPIFAGSSGPSTVIDTYFERQPGGQAFVVSFVTKDSTDDIIAYYRKQFGDKGWNVTDEDTSSAGQFAVGINFDDGNAQSLQGSVTADAFPDDPSYNKVDLLVQITSAHTNGN
ncbi:MAG TPA: hypothetical protein VFY10_05420 [Dehalococcoidia bacterium]|nr:hypothetical protein [Dehalococcoidia bacterium]